MQDSAPHDILAALGEGKRVTLNPSEVLFREGDSGRAMYILKRGTLRVVSGNTIFETVRDGGVVGEMAIIEEGRPRSATVIAGTHCELVEINRPRFLALVAGNPSFSITLMRFISRRLRVMDRRYRGRGPYP